MKIWIDLDNSPHVPLFVPIIEELRSRGVEIILTARDAFQVKELADLYRLDYQLVGHHYGRHMIWKMVGLVVRGLQLLPIVLRERPTLAVSHGSRSQLLVSSLLGIPSLTITDYEFAKGWAVIKPKWVMVPEVIPSGSVAVEPHRLLRYPGIKEDVYVSRLQVDATLRTQFGVADGEIMVTIRPPATEAHYHNPESETLLAAVFDRLSADPRVRMVVVPRNARQADDIRARWPGPVSAGAIIFPAHAVDGLNLIWHSDLVISGGGTMNREAAALGVPVYSIFRGPLGAVDRLLASEGRLVVVQSVAEVRSTIRLCPRDRRSQPLPAARAALSSIVNHITRIAHGADPVLAARVR